ncbi:hypothetical protein PHMEG_00019990 [Phytophthora megakarya]|uniref:Uncharacterized protein n=1 Tax=Phytophthora megakarya TaxID=4795 RepID=A0A225VRR1_9STRA|nr:hypothetical protein PHMEG_00019990 [Phytophthora megakarya]
MQLVRGIIVATVAIVMYCTSTTATTNVDVKEHTAEQRRLWYDRTPITKSPYQRVIPPPPPIKNN